MNSSIMPIDDGPINGPIFTLKSATSSMTSACRLHARLPVDCSLYFASVITVDKNEEAVWLAAAAYCLMDNWIDRARAWPCIFIVCLYISSLFNCCIAISLLKLFKID